MRSGVTLVCAAALLLAGCGTASGPFGSYCGTTTTVVNLEFSEGSDGQIQNPGLWGTARRLLEKANNALTAWQFESGDVTDFEYERDVKARERINGPTTGYDRSVTRKKHC